MISIVMFAKHGDHRSNECQAQATMGMMFQQNRHTEYDNASFKMSQIISHYE